MMDLFGRYVSFGQIILFLKIKLVNTIYFFVFQIQSNRFCEYFFLFGVFVSENCFFF